MLLVALVAPVMGALATTTKMPMGALVAVAGAAGAAMAGAPMSK